MKKIFDYFLQGLLWLLPFSVVIYLTYQVFLMADGFLRDPIEDLVGKSIPGLGIIVSFLSITLLGFFGQTVLALPVKWFLSNVLNKAPILKSIYTMTKDFMEAFVGKERKFEYPVVVKVNLISNLEKMGFITQEDMTYLHLPGRVAVYFPHSYNFSGELFLVPREQVTPLNIPSGAAMKFIVSGGVIKIDPNEMPENRPQEESPAP